MFDLQRKVSNPFKSWNQLLEKKNGWIELLDLLVPHIFYQL